MARIKYYFDTESSQYRRMHTRPVDMAVNVILIGILSSGIGAVIVLMSYVLNVQSPKETKLGHELIEMEFRYTELGNKINSLNTVLSRIEDRDDNIYRIVFGAEPIAEGIRNRVDQYDAPGSSTLRLVGELNDKINLFKKKLYIESLSQDELVRLTLHKQDLYAAIPAIQPISNKQLVAIASGFGLRIHPVYKVVRMHSGIDFAAPTGTAIYATADGEVVLAEEKFDGYGKMVVIDHGFSYITRYAHLQGFLVKAGQRIKRGEQIGYVGNTGLSTAPHLHYEILFRGEQIDPVHYFFNDLSPSDYEKVVQLASVENQSLGN